MHSESLADIRPLDESELDAVSGGFLPLILAGAALFSAGFAGGVVACNVVNDRPWYEF
jgi:lactobin A/cerein 7B family class IIb bacteriocin